MMYATKIRMCLGCNNSSSCNDIDSIYLEAAKEEKFYSKGSIYDYLKKNPDTIKVKLGDYPYLLPALSSKGEKYVRTESNDTASDNLLKLPRE